MESRDNQYQERRDSRDRGDSRQEIYSKVVRAGKRTYFFDVKATRGNDYYLTITESKKRFNREGRMFYEKHKLFLYKEDFDKFDEGLSSAISKIRELQALAGQNSDDSSDNDHKADSGYFEKEPTNDTPNEESKEFTEVSFEDLGGADMD